MSRLGWLAAAGLAGGAVANLVVILHASAMTTFVDAGERTPPPEELRGVDKLRVLLTGVRVPRPMPTRSPADLGLTAEQHTLPGDPHLTLWHIPAADPPGRRGVVLLAHGYAAARDQLLETAAALHARGWSVVAMDQRGSGDSGGNTTTMGYLEAEDIAAVAAWTAQTLKEPEPVLYGFSMGAASSLRAVGVLGVPARALVIEACFDDMVVTARRRFQTMGLPGSPGAELLVFWGGVLGGFSGLRHAPARYASGVAVPTLIVQGNQDPRVHVEDARVIADALGDRGRLLVVEGLGHQQLAEGQPDTWRTEVGGFLDAAAPR